MRATLELRVAGDAPAAGGGELDLGSVAAGTPTVLVIDDTQTVVASGAGETTAGVWSSHPAIIAVARAALRSLG